MNRKTMIKLLNPNIVTVSILLYGLETWKVVKNDDKLPDTF